VQVREYPDGTLGVDLGPHRLARYSRDGVPMLAAPTAKSVAAGSAPSRRPGSVGVRRTVGATASLDRASIRCPAKVRVGTEKRASGRTKKPARKKQAA
jgi:hypothetical protein